MTRSFEPEPDLDPVLPDLAGSGFKAGYPGKPDPVFMAPVQDPDPVRFGL